MSSESDRHATGAPTDTGTPVTGQPASGAAAADPLAGIDGDARRRLAEIADRLIPAAHGMPSAADVVNEDRLRFVLGSRPDLLEPLTAALRPELGEDAGARLAALERDQPNELAALQLVIVAGYYTDRRVRQLIGYPGQEAIEVRSWEYPPYLEEGLIDAVLARGPVWRDPATGRRADAPDAPRTYADRWSDVAQPAQGEQDGRDGS
jgi:hypothetical protein